jgi:hypothetical protein
MLLVLAIWSAVGPLVGVFLGAYLSHRWQREQWLLDNKKQEYRETLSALAAAYMSLIEQRRSALVNMAREEQMLRLLAQSCRVLRDRIFIADEIRSADLVNVWTTTTHLFESGQIDVGEFIRRYEAINDQLVNFARVLHA